MFIAFEGIDASGKATQSKLLAKKLNATLFSFPDYSTPCGKLILSHLKEEWVASPSGFRMLSLEENKENIKYVNDMVFQALQFTNRLEKAEELSAALKVGHVVADRYIASAIVYGGADGLSTEYLEKTQRTLKQPDLNVLLDVDPKISSTRRPDRRDRYEMDDLMSVRAAKYRELWVNMRAKSTQKKASNWVIVDGRPSVEEIHGDILQIIKESRFGA